MKLPIAALVLLLAGSIQVAHAQTSEWPEGSANAIGEKWVHDRDIAATTLKRRDRELLSLVSKARPDPSEGRLLEAVKALQQAWPHYAKAECELIGSLDLGFSPYQSAKAVQCEANLTDQRARRVAAATRCVKRIASGSSPDALEACLAQLAPMATRPN